MTRFKAPRTAILAAALLSSIGLALADVNDGPAERRLSLPGAAKGLVLPKEDWALVREQRRPDDGAVYYMMSSDRREVFFSVFVEKTATCSSAASCLKLALKNPQYKDALELGEFDEGEFRFAQFYLDQPKGAPIKQAHILANAYVEGVWYDVHISKGAKERPSMSELIEVLKKVVIK